VAGDSEEAAGDQRAREHEPLATARGAGFGPNGGAHGAFDAPKTEPWTWPPCSSDSSVVENRRGLEAHNEIWVSPAQPVRRTTFGSAGDKPGDSNRRDEFRTANPRSPLLRKSNLASFIGLLFFRCGEARFPLLQTFSSALPGAWCRPSRKRKQRLHRS
jgi:hypothetical protein